jgi:hypothetical protein
MNTRSKLLIRITIAMTLAAGAATAARAVEASGATEPGVWQKHEYSFRFMGFTSTYSCDGLADQLGRLLTLAGARADAKSVPGACASNFGRPDKFASAKLTFYTLAPAATGATGELTGAWRPVSLGDRRPLDLQVGDCELVEQFRDEVLKKMFTIRSVADNTRCVPHQASGSLIDLRFESFVAAPGASAPTAAAGTPNLFVYPKAGQNKEQQAKDRAECNVVAVAQSGFDPAQPAAAGGAGKNAAYATAFTSCLGQRGYTVR